MRHAVFVDTTAWYAAVDSGDVHHVRASRRLRRLRESRRPIVTTNHVVGESYTLLLGRLGVEVAQAYLRRARRDPAVRRAFVPERWEEEALRLIEQFSDQSFSYVDATSFVAMRHLGIEQALSFDADFLIAGFTLMSDE